MQGTWDVEETPAGSRITMRFEYEMKYGLAGRLLGLVVARKFRPITERLLDNWELVIAERQGTPGRAVPTSSRDQRGSV